MHKRTLYGRAVKMCMLGADYAKQIGYAKVYGQEKLRFMFERK